MKREAKLEHAEFYHREKIESARAEGERLRGELRRRGIDPTLILIAAGQMARKSAVRLVIMLVTVFCGAAETNETVTITVPKNATLRIEDHRAAVTNSLPMPPPMQIIPMSVQIRMAKQIAAGQAAPWNQRFIVTKVEEFALTRIEEDDKGLPNGIAIFSTNYAVTIAPVAANETNPPVVWGVTKTKQIRFFTTRYTKKGDEYDFFPLQ